MNYVMRTASRCYTSRRLTYLIYLILLGVLYTHSINIIEEFGNGNVAELSLKLIPKWYNRK
jgi:hypothetical protein